MSGGTCFRAAFAAVVGRIGFGLIGFGLIACAVLAAGATSAAAAGSQFTSSAIGSPAGGSELFYDGDSDAGSVTVRGTVSPALPGAQGDLQCYSAADTIPNPQGLLAGGVDVSSGSFAISVSLAKVAGQACRLAMVPSGRTPTGAAASAFTGPAISVSYQASHAAKGNLFNFSVQSGTLAWSYALGSLGSTGSSCPIGADACACPITNSWATDPQTLGTWTLFTGNACLPQNTGLRSALVIDGHNAYPPGSLGGPGGGLTGAAGFEPLAYNTSFDAAHDTVTISDTESPTICDGLDGVPVTAGSCPSLHDSGIQVQQTTTVLPGGQVARVSQRFSSIDGAPHAIDALFSQSVSAPPGTSAQPGFQFPGETGPSHRGAPTAVTSFPPGPGSIFVISDPTQAAAVSNPMGAITYGRPPISATFSSAARLSTGTFVMRYIDTIPAGGAVVYDWSFSQASSVLGAQALERVERDRFSTPTVRIASPRNHSTSRTQRLTIRGSVSDPVGIASLRINGIGVAGTPTGAFSLPIKLKQGSNPITATVINLAGNAAATTITINYRPPVCKVPRLSGRTLLSARSALRRANCELGRVRRTTSKTVRRGRVIATTPRAGAKRRSGTRIGLSLSTGRPQLARRG